MFAYMFICFALSFSFFYLIPESVCAKGSFNSGGLLYIFTCSHLHHIFSSSHLLILTSSHLHIQTSAHLQIFHIFTSSRLLIFSSFLFLSLSLPLSFSLALSSLSLSLSSLSLSHSLSLSVSCPLSWSLSFFFFSLLRPAGSANEAPRNGNLFARHEVRVAKTVEKNAILK